MLHLFSYHAALLQGVADMTDLIAVILLPVAIVMCGYALVVFLWRGSRIAKKQVLLLYIVLLRFRFAGRCLDDLACHIRSI